VFGLLCTLTFRDHVQSKFTGQCKNGADHTVALIGAIMNGQADAR
jgi:hypothetical protein